MNKNMLSSDLNYILQHTPSIWDELKNKSIFITGGTGFIGTWLLETFAWANHELHLNMSVCVLTRNIDAFAKKAPHLISDSTFTFLKDDIRHFLFTEKNFSHIIHGATQASASLNQHQPSLMLDTILQGTRRSLELATMSKAKKFLLLSSGAIYGKQPPDMHFVEEDFLGATDALNPRSAYSIGKHTAEHMCILHAAQHNIEIKIARCFAFVGPHLPLDAHFAIGNFIRDGLSGNDIMINGDGSPYRSYQYAADLVIWLLHILCHGEANVPYNVGSDEAISILDLATLVAKHFSPSPNIIIKEKRLENAVPERYIPSIKRAQTHLGLTKKIDLSEAISKTIKWHQQCKELKT